MASWERVVNTTLKDYMREEEVNILRNRKLTGILEQKGRFVNNKSGTEFNWPVRYKRAPMQGYSDSETLVYQRRNRHKKAELDWRAYVLTDSATKMEKLMNKGAAQIIDLFDNMKTGLKDDFTEAFAGEFYIDGNLPANAKRIHGIESFMGAGSVGTLIAAPNDTFAKLLTNLGNYGGTWTGTWPNGSGSAEYDFWSPVLIDYTNAGWSATVKTWENTCIEALRFGIIQTQRNAAKSGRLDMILIDREMYRLFLNRLDEKERIQTQHNASNSLLIKLGFGDTTNFDGVDVTWEFGSPGDTGYGFNADMMEVRSLQKNLTDVTGPNFDQRTKSWIVDVDFMGNCRWNPRFFSKWKNYT